MRTTINKELGDIVEMHNLVKMINVNDDVGDGADAWDDYRHYSEVMCSKVLNEIDNTLDSAFIRHGIPYTTPKKYAKVYAAYRLGCGFCTRVGHGPQDPECKSGEKKGLKRQNISGANIPPPKK